MIVNFSVENFGSIKTRQTLSFQADKSTHLEDYYIIKTDRGDRILKIALIYGANASGKTTVLNALEFLRKLVLDPAEKKTDELEFEPYLFDQENATANTVLSIEFIQNDIKYMYRVEFMKKAIVSEELYFFKPNKANIFIRKTNLVSQFTEIKFGSKIKKDKTFEKTLEANTLWNNTVLGGFLKTNIELPELKETTSWFNEYLRPLIFKRTDLSNYVTARIGRNEIDKKDIVNVLTKADFNISDILIDEKEKQISDEFISFFEGKINLPKIKMEELKAKGTMTTVKLQLEHFVNGKKFNLPFDLESQGTKRYYGFAGLLVMMIKNGVAFPIDELEDSLHPDLYIHFLLSFLINSKQSQIIATTHNREIFDDRDIFRNDAIWFTDKMEGLGTELYSLSDFDSSVIRDTSNIYSAYKSGKLKGAPNLGDYYIDLQS